MRLPRLVPAVALCAGGALAQPLSTEEGAAELARLAEEARQEWAGMSYEEFKASVPYVEEIGKWVVDGDVAIRNEKLLREFWEQNVARPPEVAPGDAPEFAIKSVGGLDQIWNEHSRRALSYCVSTAFGDRHSRVVEDMAAAAAAWEAAGDLDFVHVEAEDADCTPQNGNVLFDVGPMSAGGRLLAVAFFPNEPRPARTLRINDSAFGLDPSGALSLRGILRHELGHVIGGRHEHTRPEAGRCFEDDEWRGVTDYDAFSVMHYPHCNGEGDWTLNLTASDRSGVACVYGPAPGFLIDTSICKPASGFRAFGPFTLAAGESETLEPLDVAGGARLTVRLFGEGEDPGDPDLYLKFDGPALVSDFDCRPFEVGPDEVCDVTVPAGSTLASIMVNAATDAGFRVEVTGAGE